MLPKFVGDCNQLLPDGAAASARSMGSVHIAHVLQQCLLVNCLEMIQKK